MTKTTDTKTDTTLTTQTTSTKPEAKTSAVATTTNTTPPDDPNLPADYLANGYCATAENGKQYLHPELVGEHALHIASMLNEMKLVDFNSLIRILKSAKTNSLPFAAKKTAALELLPKSLLLISKKKAPNSLASFLQHNINNVNNSQDWQYFYRHMEAIAGFMAIKEKK